MKHPSTDTDLRIVDRLLSSVSSFFLTFSFSICYQLSLSPISTRLQIAVMDDTSGSKTASPLSTHNDAGSVEADQGAPVIASSNIPITNDGKKPSEVTPRDFRFWAIIASLCITGLLGALENTVVTTSLPTIVRALNLGDNYIWITNVFFLTRYAIFFGDSGYPELE